MLGDERHVAQCFYVNTGRAVHIECGRTWSTCIVCWMCVWMTLWSLHKWVVPEWGSVAIGIDVPILTFEWWMAALRCSRCADFAYELVLIETDGMNICCRTCSVFMSTVEQNMWTYNVDDGRNVLSDVTNRSYIISILKNPFPFNQPIEKHKSSENIQTCNTQIIQLRWKITFQGHDDNDDTT